MTTKTIYLGLIILLLGLLIQCNNNSAKISLTNSTNCFDTIIPIIYNCEPSENGDYAFHSIPSKQLKVKLIPNLETRIKMRIKEVDGIIGIHQFFLDHDLVSGFVHPFTTNMFNKLKPADFVLKYHPDSVKLLTGTISFIHKANLTQLDTLGKNIAFFRQWRLSEIEYKLQNGQVYTKTDICKFDTRCACPQSKKTGNMTQIPIWQIAETGYQPLNKYADFGHENGGTVVIIWEVNNEIWFQDVHSSWNVILNRTIEISKAYNIDPAICISDAGPFARKLKADKNFRVKVIDIDALARNGKRFGAGYAYLHEQ